MIKVVSIRSALDRKGNEKERSLQNCLLSLWLCVILAAALTLKQARKDFDHFFSSSFFDQNKKQSIPKRIWIFSLTNRASIFFAVFSFYFYAFTSRISMNYMLCLFGFLAPSSHVIGKCLTFMELGMLLHPPFPFYLFFYRDELFPFCTASFLYSGNLSGW